MLDDENIIWIVNMVLVLIVIYAIYFVVVENFVKKHNKCNRLDGLYGGGVNGKIQPIWDSDPKYKHGLRDYYIKSAYNCCSGGDYRNDYVDICNLKSILKTGARCLDFEIYSLKHEPVVSTSASAGTCYKESYNYVKFEDVMHVLKSSAFGSREDSPNPTDPLIIHLRMRSNDNKMFDNLAGIFEKFDSIMLGRAYSYSNHDNNFGATPLTNLRGKITVIADASQSNFQTTSKKFMEYVNEVSGSIYMRALHYNDIRMSIDIDELRRFNRQFMTIAMPDLGYSPLNPSGLVMRDTGCQFLAMRFQTVDTNLTEVLEFFDFEGTAFVLKPEPLRYKAIEIKKPEPQSKKLSYGEMTVDGGFFKFKI